MARNLLIVVVAVLLLASAVTPAAAAVRADREGSSAQVMTWSASNSNTSLGLPGWVQPDGDCETGNAGGCPF